MKRFLIPMAALLALVVCGPALAAVPQTMSYQGVLTDGAGNIAADGNYSITFRIWDDPTLISGHLLWTEAHDGVTAPVVPVSKGGFSVVLGSAVPVNVQFNGPMWLELQVAPDATPVAPRTQLTPSPYALNARNVFDGGSSNFVGIGRSTRVTGNEYFGVLAPVTGGVYGGMYIQTGANGLPFYGYDVPGLGRAWTYLDGSDGAKWKLSQNGLTVLTATTAGNVGIGTTTPGANLEVAGTTTLGTGGPAIQTLKFTGTTSASQNGQVTIATGIPADKILAVDAMVQYTGTGWVSPGYTVNPGYEFNWYIYASDIIIWNKAGNSSAILSQPFKLLVTYEK